MEFLIASECRYYVCHILLVLTDAGGVQYSRCINQSYRGSPSVDRIHLSLLCC